MGTLVFQATLGGQVNLTGPNTASTFTISVPAVTGTMITSGDTATVTSTMISGPITTAKGGTGLTSFTANGVVYASSTSALATGSAFVFDGTNVGIGTSSPTAFGAGYTTLTITGSTAGIFQSKTTTGDARLYATSTDAKVGSWANTALNFYTNATLNATLDASGNLGLGVTPSAWATITALQVKNASFSGYSNEAHMNANYYYNAGGKYIATDYATRYVQTSGQHAWYNAPSGTAGNAITFTQAMTLDASGNLLVGQTSNPAVGRIAATFAGNTTNGLELKDSTDTAGAGYIFFRNSAGTATGSVTRSTGNTVLYNVSSDQRLKTNIVEAPESNVDAIKVRSFDWVADGSHQRYGFIAQELVTVAPEAVHQPADPDEMMAVDYSKLVPMLVKEIQSLRKRLAAAGI